MKKRVLDVGNCGPDYSAIRHMIEAAFEASVDQADRAEDTLQKLKAQTYDLILVNRKLDCDYSDGMEVIRQLKADDKFAKVPVMLVTNFAEHQDAAEQIGAVRGFGKNDVGSNATVALLSKYLA